MVKYNFHYLPKFVLYFLPMTIKPFWQLMFARGLQSLNEEITDIMKVCCKCHCTATMLTDVMTPGLIVPATNGTSLDVIPNNQYSHLSSGHLHN